MLELNLLGAGLPKTISALPTQPPINRDSAITSSSASTTSETPSLVKRVALAHARKKPTLPSLSKKLNMATAATSTHSTSSPSLVAPVSPMAVSPQTFTLPELQKQFFAKTMELDGLMDKLSDSATFADAAQKLEALKANFKPLLEPGYAKAKFNNEKIEDLKSQIIDGQKQNEKSSPALPKVVATISAPSSASVSKLTPLQDLKQSFKTRSYEGEYGSAELDAATSHSSRASSLSPNRTQKFALPLLFRASPTGSLSRSSSASNVTISSSGKGSRSPSSGSERFESAIGTSERRSQSPASASSRSSTSSLSSTISEQAKQRAMGPEISAEIVSDVQTVLQETPALSNIIFNLKSNQFKKVFAKKTLEENLRDYNTLRQMFDPALFGADKGGVTYNSQSQGLKELYRLIMAAPSLSSEL